MAETLHELAVKHGTDKACHGYCPFYEQVFGPYRDRVTKVLELGVKDGASLRMWLDYFPNAHIFGLENGNMGNPDLWPRGDRVTIFAGDQARVPDLWSVVLRAGGRFDIILDDGGHTMWQQQLSFAALWPSVRSGGFYVIEDTHTSRLDGFGRQDAPETTETMLGRLRLELGFSLTSFAGTERDATTIIHKDPKAVTLP